LVLFLAKQKKKRKELEETNPGGGKQRLSADGIKGRNRFVILINSNNSFL
jgi:hypothetical protein